MQTFTEDDVKKAFELIEFRDGSHRTLSSKQVEEIMALNSQWLQDELMDVCATVLVEMLEECVLLRSGELEIEKLD